MVSKLVSTSCKYVSAGCSPETDIIDVGPDGYLSYASGANVLLTHVDGSIPVILEDGPSEQVHSIRILSEDCESLYVVSCSADGFLKVWDIKGRNLAFSKKLDCSLNSLSISRHSSGRWRIVISDITGKLFMFDKLPSDEFSHDGKVIAVAPKKIISLASIWAHDHHVIFAGLSDNTLTVILDSKPVLSLSGHGNWINSIDCSPINNGAFYVSTGSSDRTIRIWKVSPKQSRHSDIGLVELVPSKREIKLNDQTYLIECDAILYGHESMIHSVRWDKSINDQTPLQDYRLLTAAADHTLILWQSTRSGWVSSGQLGDISNIGTVGGDRSFGFFSGILFSLDNGVTENVITHGSTGSIIKYRRQMNNGTSTFLINTPIATGHISAIEGCDWDSRGECILTTGLDKTTRIFADNLRDGNWYEIARPQIHGYEMRSVSSLQADQFISCGDEKILRCFKAPKSFTSRLDYFKLRSSEVSSNDELDMVVVPALGLSNKSSNDESVSQSRPDAPLTDPPTEYDLSRQTLWIETDKLYGHGLEVYCLAVSNDKRIAASASKATTAEDAVIRFWIRSDDGLTWIAHPETIKAHTLTVIKMAFSPDDKYLVAVSRDRSYSLTCIERHDSIISIKLDHVKAAHSRIIWSLDWSPKGDLFVTGARDKTVKFWNLKGEQPFPTLEMDTPITALAISSTDVLAIGLETGAILIYQIIPEKGVDFIGRLEGKKNGASSSITDMKWRPCHSDSADTLAVTSSVLQIFQLDLK